MGYRLSCKAESAIAVCDPYNWDRKKKKKQQQRHRSNNVRKFSYAELESATGGFSSSSFLGKGSHGTVYRAVIDGGNLIAAVKKTRTAATAFVQDDNANNSPADNEIEILSRIRSHRFVNLLGYCLDPKEKKKLLVVELMPNGSLYDLLHSTSLRPPGWSKRIRLALQTAKAVETLHSSNPPVIHRDIKSSNVLLDGNWNARLGDFGLALRGHVEDVRIRCTPPAGTLGYLDPGYITPENLSSKSDVFSFGILLLEIISGRNAIDMNYSPSSVVDWALPLIRKGKFTSLYDPRIGPPEEPSVVMDLALLASRCVASDVEKRPAMAEVVGCLRLACKRVNSISPIWRNIRRLMVKPSLSMGAQVFDVEVELDDVAKSSRHGSRNSSLMRSRRVSSVQPSMDFVIELSGPVRKRACRSKSIGSATERKMGSNGNFSVNQQLALVRRRSGFVLRMPYVRLNKSKSMPYGGTASSIRRD
ncbi:serine/threonine-protein kinase-like protein At3g51990 [Telopea speciosissima]|uniref:serine/threonine-protein kinase-like protein At3g51990 n=1 Tax=Telopea speciosissima TaxID=54955 RepID=UPI001CC71795|nr:serine/threonine-protein kinase-like protein At3g51990 [Telopea speciosissima]